MNEHGQHNEPQDDASSPSFEEAIEKLRQRYPVFDFQEMSGGSNIVVIQYDGAIYTLKRTRNNRLVLHK